MRNLLQIFYQIKNRCYNNKSKLYRNYGGRGIFVCKEWLDDPQLFIEYVCSLEGFDDLSLSLDRIDNDGNYEPKNIRWANNSTQAQNRRGVKLTKEDIDDIRSMYDSGNYFMKEIASKFDVSISRISQIINKRTWN